jgi:hypothetical protein
MVYLYLTPRDILYIYKLYNQQNYKDIYQYFHCCLAELNTYIVTNSDFFICCLSFFSLPYYLVQICYYLQAYPLLIFIFLFLLLLLLLLQFFLLLFLLLLMIPKMDSIAFLQCIFRNNLRFLPLYVHPEYKT